jgi:hypothetical protein
MVPSLAAVGSRGRGDIMEPLLDVAPRMRTDKSEVIPL